MQRICLKTLSSCWRFICTISCYTSNTLDFLWDFLLLGIWEDGQEKRRLLIGERHGLLSPVPLVVLERFRVLGFWVLFQGLQVCIELLLERVTQTPVCFEALHNVVANSPCLLLICSKKCRILLAFDAFFWCNITIIMLAGTGGRMHAGLRSTSSYLLAVNGHFVCTGRGCCESYCLSREMVMFLSLATWACAKCWLC